MKRERLTKEEEKVIDNIDLNNIIENEPIKIEQDNSPVPTDLEWTDYVLSFLDESEIIEGNPKTDGLRRILPLVLRVDVIESSSRLVQYSDVYIAEHTLVIEDVGKHKKYVDIASATKENTPEKFWNHLPESATTKAEGRALRKALNIKKLAVEELEKPETQTKTAEISTNPDEHLLEIKEDGPIQKGQLQAIHIMCGKTGVDLNKYLEHTKTKCETFLDAKIILKELSSWARNKDEIPTEVKK